MATSADRLPGVRFETVRPGAPPTLPRMDIAAFAGFAASGPVGLPVAVEDVVRFHDVFGTDLPLAWDPDAGAVAYAHMPQALREYFRNGGRRAWVVRLAEGAGTGHFLLPGLLCGSGGTVTGAAWSVAASPGSWSDGVRAHASLLRTGLPPASWEVVTDGPAPGVRLLRPDTAALLRLEVGDDVIAFLPPAPADTAADRSRGERAAGQVRPAALGYWFQRALPGQLPRRNPAELRLLDGAGAHPLAVRRWSTGAEARFVVPAAEVTGVEPGAWLRLDMAMPPASRFGDETWLVVDEVSRGPVWATLTARRAWRALKRDRGWAWALARRPFQASLVAAELWATREGAGTARVADVGLAAAHPRWFGHFPEDQALYASAETLGQGPAGALWLELSRPRFPLAAPRQDADVLLPLGLEALPRPEFEQRARTDGRTALERDGVSRVTAGLFLDPDLAAVPAARLLGDAFHIEYGAAVTRRLGGVHALLGIEEASILAVPDAVQPGFVPSDGAARTPPTPPSAPSILLVSARDDAGRVYVEWSNVRDATGYLLEYGPDPRFRGVTRTLRTAESTAEVSLDGACLDRMYIRVRAQTGAGVTAWSNTGLAAPPGDAFDRCGRTALRAPDLRPLVESGDRLLLRWRGAGGHYRVESAAEPSFSAPETVYEGPALRTEVWPPARATWFRVAAARDGEESPWSRTVAYVPPLPFRWEVANGSAAAAAAAARLLDIHVALLRMCAARADMFAILSLPPGFREAAALAHVPLLGARFDADAAGRRELSFGALYHPWLVVPAPGGTGPLRRTPPDGAMCGLLAARTLASGAWAAPANRALGGVVTLHPQLPESVRASFLGRRVNAVAPFPEGFLVWSEETLSDDAEFASIGVRRLLILLRRLAVREGTLHVFQPGSASFRRLVHRQFDRLLGDLFSRGAFAGRRPDEGYRVVTGDAANPAESVEQGRLVVELRVAPSRPLHFLTVRLVQTGGGLTVGGA